MDQKQTMIGLLMIVILAFGGLIFYDVKYGHKFAKLINRNGQAQNWRWEDGWDGRGPSGTVPPPMNGPNEGPSIPPMGGPSITAQNYSEALQKSGELGKPVLVFFTAEWCTYCQKMKAETMSNTSVQAVLSNYILVYVDTDKDRNAARKFGVEGLPSYVVTNSKEDKLKFETGFKQANTFATWLNDPSMFNQPKNAQPQPRTEPEPKREPDRRQQPPQRRPTQPPPNSRPPSGGIGGGGCGPGG